MYAEEFAGLFFKNMEENLNEDKGDKDLQPKENVLSEIFIKQFGKYLHDKPYASSKIPDDMIATDERFQQRHSVFRINTIGPVLEQPRFGVRLRDITQPSSLISVIYDIQRALHEDAVFYHDMVGKSLHTLRVLRDRPYTFVQDVYRASCQSSLPLEVRVLLRSSLGHSLERFKSQINSIILEIEDGHIHHSIRLEAFVNQTKKALKSLSTFAQTRIQEGALFVVRTAIITYIGPVAAINRYSIDNESFSKTIKREHEKLAECIDQIQETRNVLQRHFAGRISHYQHPKVFTYLRRTMEFLKSSEMFVPENDIMRALFRLEHLCDSLREI